MMTWLPVHRSQLRPDSHTHSCLSPHPPAPVLGSLPDIPFSPERRNFGVGCQDLENLFFIKEGGINTKGNQYFVEHTDEAAEKQLTYNTYIYNLKTSKGTLAGVAQWTEHQPENEKGHRFDSQSGHMLGLWARSQVGDTREATTH